jgi:GAF domain-containing protein
MTNFLGWRRVRLRCRGGGGCGYGAAVVVAAATVPRWWWLRLRYPWASERQTPLSHSFCQHVVESRRPLVVSDAREHPKLRDNVAIRDLGVIAYAGVPLITPTGQVLGTLCASITSRGTGHPSRSRSWPTSPGPC